MSSKIEIMRNLIQKSYSDLALQNPDVADMNPLTEIVDSVSNGFRNLGKPEYIKNVDQKLIFKSKDIIRPKFQPVNIESFSDRSHFANPFAVKRGFPISQVTHQFPISQVTQDFPISQVTHQFPISQVTHQFPTSQVTHQFPTSQVTQDFPKFQVTHQFPTSQTSSDQGELSNKSMAFETPKYHSQIQSNFPNFPKFPGMKYDDNDDNDDNKSIDSEIFAEFSPEDKSTTEINLFNDSNFQSEPKYLNVNSDNKIDKEKLLQSYIERIDRGEDVEIPEELLDQETFETGNYDDFDDNKIDKEKLLQSYIERIDRGEDVEIPEELLDQETFETENYNDFDDNNSDEYYHDLVDHYFYGENDEDVNINN